MAVHDRESLRFMIYERALFTVGRIVLGYKGRKIARERRREVRLEEVNGWYLYAGICLLSSTR